MLWKLFSSDKRIMAALEQSTGYDISPGVLTFPANTDEAPQLNENGKPRLTLWEDYSFQKDSQEIDVSAFWARAAYSK